MTASNFHKRGESRVHHTGLNATSDKPKRSQDHELRSKKLGRHYYGPLSRFNELRLRLDGKLGAYSILPTHNPPGSIQG